MNLKGAVVIGLSSSILLGYAAPAPAPLIMWNFNERNQPKDSRPLKQIVEAERRRVEAERRERQIQEDRRRGLLSSCTAATSRAGRLVSKSCSQLR